MTGYNRSGFRVERLKLAPDPESWDACAVKCTKQRPRAYAFFETTPGKSGPCRAAEAPNT